MNKNIFKYDGMKRQEHMAVRNNVGWYFGTHQLLEIAGPDVVAFLDYMYHGNIATLKVGRDRYTTMLDVIEALVKDSIEDQKFFSIRDKEIDGIPVKIKRGGFTGEKWGYEIYLAPDQLEHMEELVDAEVKKNDGMQVTEFQIMSWTLPTEAGIYYMRDLAHTNPFEVGLEKNINWEKDFIGREALLKVKENGPEREMPGFEVLEDDFYIRSKQYGGPGEAVYIDSEEEEIGRVSKLVYSYVKEVNNGYLLVKKDKLHVGDHFKIHGYECVVTERNWLG